MARAIRPVKAVADNKGSQEGKAGTHHQDGRGVRPDTEESPMGDGDEAGIAHQEVQAGGENGEDQHGDGQMGKVSFFPDEREDDPQDEEEDPASTHRSLIAASPVSARRDPKAGTPVPGSKG